MRQPFRTHRPTRRAAFVLLALPALLSFASPGWGADKAPVPPGAPKLRVVVDIPEDFVGREFTYTVRLTAADHWLQRDPAVGFYIFVQDLEGTRLPRQGFTPAGLNNSLRFVLPKDEGRKVIERLSTTQLHEARIRFRVSRVRNTITGEWQYLARISAVELPK